MLKPKLPGMCSRSGSGTCVALLRFGRKRVVGTEMPVVAFVVGDGEGM